MPLNLYALARRERFQEAKDEQHLMDCIECGSCAYVCPAKLPLVQMIRVSKSALRRKQH
jgi:electron transport complex protein RnfC